MIFKNMDSAPKDGTSILAFCCHERDEYFDSENNMLTVYGAHCEGARHVENGFHVIQWGGEYIEDGPEDVPVYIPPYWFRAGSDFEEVANPICWRELPTKEELENLFVEE